MKMTTISFGDLTATSDILKIFTTIFAFISIEIIFSRHQACDESNALQ